VREGDHIGQSIEWDGRDGAGLGPREPPPLLEERALGHCQGFIGHGQSVDGRRNRTGWAPPAGTSFVPSPNRAYRHHAHTSSARRRRVNAPIVREELEPDPTSPSRARSLVRHALDTWGLADDVRVAELLTSELVTNAVEHAATPIIINISFDMESVRVEIIDTGAEMPALVSVPDTSGYGLQIVDRLASRWGIDQVPQIGKNVWFELDVAGPELSPSHPN
jgi:hypothetical protein